jgi:CBS domain-containing protein
MKPVDTIDSLLKSKGRHVWSIEPTAMVFDAIQKMSDKSIGALLVISEGRLDGIISERDYARKVILKDRSSKHTQVREIMTSLVIVVSPEDTVEECMRLMTEHRIRHLPVMDSKRVVGVISIGDLVRWTIQSHEETIVQLEGYIEGKYPG